MLLPKLFQFYRRIRLFTFYFRINYLQTLLGNLVCLYDSLAEHYHLHNNEPIKKKIAETILQAGTIMILMASTTTSLHVTINLSCNLNLSGELLTFQTLARLPAPSLVRTLVSSSCSHSGKPSTDLTAGHFYLINILIAKLKISKSELIILPLQCCSSFVYFYL